MTHLQELIQSVDPISIEQTSHYAIFGFLAPALKWIGAKALPAIGKFLGFGGGKAAAAGAAGSAAGLTLGKVANTFGQGLGIAQGIAGLGRGRKEYEMNRNLMYEKFGLDKQMYDYQNAYNTPAMQMQRLKDAGLNPALMYGQGTTGNATGYPQASVTAPYQHTPTDFQPLLSSITTSTQADLTKASAVSVGIDNARKTKTFNDDVAYAELNRMNAQAQYDKQVEEKLNIIAQRNVIEKQAEKLEIEREIQAIDRDFFKKHDLAPSDYGLFKGLKRLGVDTATIIEALLTGDFKKLEDYIFGSGHTEERNKKEGNNYKKIDRSNN